MKRNLRKGRLPTLLGLAICMCLWTGCGSSGPPMGSVLGKITFEGQPLTAGIVTLVDEEIGAGASVELDASGNYHIPSVQIGEYTVAVHNNPPPPGGEFIKLDIPSKYQDLESSGLSVTVEAGENHADFDL